jgi:dolichol kinase
LKHIGRKLFHLLGGLGLLSLYFIFNRNTALLLYAALAVVVLALEIARLKVPAWNRFLYGRFGSFIRESEAQKPTGTLPYVLGVGLSLYVYQTAVAATAICFLAAGDVAATAIGERYGKTKIGDKSLEGTLAFVLAALLAGGALFFLGMGVLPWIMVLGAVVAAGVELLPVRVNDNLMIPLLSGAVMELALGFAR